MRGGCPARRRASGPRRCTPSCRQSTAKTYPQRPEGAGGACPFTNRTRRVVSEVVGDHPTRLPSSRRVSCRVIAAAPWLVSSDASPTCPEWAVTRSTPATRAAVPKRNRGDKRQPSDGRHPSRTARPSSRPSDSSFLPWTVTSTPSPSVGADLAPPHRGHMKRPGDHGIEPGSAPGRLGRNSKAAPRSRRRWRWQVASPAARSAGLERAGLARAAAVGGGLPVAGDDPGGGFRRPGSVFATGCRRPRHPPPASTTSRSRGRESEAVALERGRLDAVSVGLVFMVGDAPQRGERAGPTSTTWSTAAGCSSPPHPSELARAPSMRISEEVEHGFREVEHGFREVEHPFRGKWNSGSGVVNARR